MSTEPNPCWATWASCMCDEPAGHESPHVCECGGRWYFDERGEFYVDDLPQLMPGNAHLRSLLTLIELKFLLPKKETEV